MRKLILIAVGVNIIACHSKDEVISKAKENELKIHYSELLKNIDSTYKLDSFRFIRLDTIKMKDVYTSYLFDIVHAQTLNINKIKISLPILKSKLRLQSLSAGLSRSLYDNYKFEVSDENDKLQVMFKNDSLLRQDIDSLKFRKESADSINPVLYQARCLYQFKRKDMSVEKDTTLIILNDDMNIINLEDINKMKLDLYKPLGDLETKDDF